MARIKLVTGGARSGKSSYALEWSEKLGKQRCFIATCPITDSEMKDRINAHQLERQGRGWATLEEEHDIENTIISLKGSYDTLLIDCLTLWINNLLYEAEQQGQSFGEKDMAARAEKLVLAAEQFDGNICFVTNEVGLGIVPDNALARKYRDLVGRCNRIVANRATDVVLVSCGIAMVLKES
ncbi:bifunctional adenosylcobinamide kinase/adenosylcobinamide-phosphate guanylyltransferase [Desulfopila sp. IMCC35008]|uniref:bifunctional adenosylcobinamide kinase/adenosylcobinamide-phosphate guanylyltransferase n=1 Tax=Desulfopila sp. IMCC35008 TaxID=2653858 RepID=UPI0013CFCFF1|nr:bifunctional adenosylcobinamide kinase/adenosylcobinamide-phosphate guanylyltransferase [Desulfopila sp. IMCC35008]